MRITGRAKRADAAGRRNRRSGRRAGRYIARAPFVERQRDIHFALGRDAGRACRCDRASDPAQADIAGHAVAIDEVVGSEAHHSVYGEVTLLNVGDFVWPEVGAPDRVRTRRRRHPARLPALRLPLLVDALEEFGGVVVVVDQIAGIVVSPDRARRIAAEEVREVVKFVLARRRVAERHDVRPCPHLGQDAPVVGGVADLLVPVGVTDTDFRLAQESVFRNIVGQIAANGELVAFAPLEMVHRRAPELHVGATEIVLVPAGRQIGEIGIPARPRLCIGGDIRRVRDDDRQIAGKVEFLVRECRTIDRDVVDVVLRMGVLRIDVEVQALVQLLLEIDAEIVVRVFLEHLPTGENLLDTAERNEGRSVVRPRPAPARSRAGDVAGLEQAVLVIDVVLEIVRRALDLAFVGGLTTARRVEKAAARIGVVFRIVGRGLERAFVPGVGGVRTDVLRGQKRATVDRFVLQRRGNAVTLAVEFLRAELPADRGEAQIGQIGETVRTRPLRGAAGVGRRQGRVVGARREPVTANEGFESIGEPDGRTVARLVVRDLKTVGTALDARIVGAEQNADGAAVGFPRIADQPGYAGRPFLAEIAVIRLGAQPDVEALIVERLAGVEVDRTCKAAFDHVGGRVLADDYRAEQFRRNVGEVNRLTVDASGECVAAVEFGADEVETTNDDARTFDGEVIGVVRTGEAVDGDAGQPLQRFGDRAVGKRADVFGGDGIDDGVGITLDVLSGRERLPDTGDDDDIGIVRGRHLFFRLRILRVGGLRDEQPAKGDAGRTCFQKPTQPVLTSSRRRPTKHLSLHHRPLPLC